MGAERAGCVPGSVKALQYVTMEQLKAHAVDLKEAGAGEQQQQQAGSSSSSKAHSEL